jgi:hypothetical protein
MQAGWLEEHGQGQAGSPSDPVLVRRHAFEAQVHGEISDLQKTIGRFLDRASMRGVG